LSFNDFKEVSSNNTGSSTRYGGNDVKEIMQILNNKTVSNRRVSIKNPWRFTEFFDFTPASSGTPAAPTDANNTRIYADPSDFKLKAKKVGGTVIELENVDIPSSALQTISDKAKLNANIFYKDQNNDIGDFYIDFGDIGTPSNPAAGKRRLFLDTTSGELSVRTSGGATVSLEGAGGGGGDVSTTTSNTYGDFDQIFRSSRVKIRNPANTQSYSLVGSAITAARNITLPLLTGNDTAVMEAFAQTLTNKTIAAGSNTISGIADAHISAHTTTKITTASKSLLNSAIVYNDQNNNLGDFYLDFGDITTPANPAAGTRRLFHDSTSGKLSVRTSAGGTVALESTIYPDAASGGSIWGLWTGGARQGTGMFSNCLMQPTPTTVPSTFQGSNTSWQATTDFVTNATSATQAGFQGPQPTQGGWFTTRSQNFRFKVKLQTDALTNKRIFVGFIGANTVPTATDTLIGTAVAGFGFRFSSTTDTTWKVLRNDTSGAAVTVDSGVTVTANSPDTLEIIADDANTQIGWSIDGSAITNYTTDIPSNITPLNYFVILETKTASAQRFRVYYAYLTQVGV
jgi:hypothetical protein